MAAKSKLAHWLAWLRPQRPVRNCTDLIFPPHFITDFFAVVEPILAKSGTAEVETSALSSSASTILFFHFGNGNCPF